MALVYPLTLPDGSKTWAKPDLFNYSFNQLLNQNWTPDRAYRRALKVYLMSYLGYDQISPQLNQIKFNEFSTQMMTCLGVTQTDPQIVQQVVQDMYNESLIINICVIGLDQTSGQLGDPNPTVEFMATRTGSVVMTKQLTRAEKIQANVGIGVPVGLRRLIDLRQQNELITVRFIDNIFGVQLSFISYRQIHAEGFEDWLDFGHSGKLLVKVYVTVDQEKGATVDEQSDYHMRFIYAVIYDRFKWCEQHPDHSRHSESTHKAKVSYIRSKIDPTFEEAFWFSPPKTSMVDVAHHLKYIDDEYRQQYFKDHILAKTVRKCDFQIGFRAWLEFEDSVCLCNEWCNWNAFFHFNPIYRFLLHQHNRMFMKNRSNVPDMYLVMTLNLATFMSYVNFTPKVPIFRLIHGANDYRKRYNTEYFSKSQLFVADYIYAKPVVIETIAVMYGLLRLEIKADDLRLNLDTNPLSVLSGQDIRDYMELISEIHRYIEPYDSLVLPANKYKWSKEIEVILRAHFKDYLKKAYDLMFTKSQQTSIFDHLFSKDFEFKRFIGKDEDKKAVIKCRTEVTILGTDGNPMNTKFIVNAFLNTLISVNTVFTRVEPTFPMITRHEAWRKTFEMCKQFDTDFVKYFQTCDPTTGDRLYWFDFKLSEQLDANQTDKYMTFYTLKMLSVLYGIQVYCIVSSNKTSKLAFDEFECIWAIDLIQESVSYKINDPMIFEIHNILDQSIDDFYTTLWGKAAHEYDPSMTNPPVLPWEQYIMSAFFQYQRLYYWLKSDGNNHPKFTIIFQYLEDIFNKNLFTSEVILKDKIMKTIKSYINSYDYSIEVMDYLVYYLVKSNCCTLLSNLTVLLSKIHDTTYLGISKTGRYCYFHLCKPGWIQVLKTMSTAKQFIGRLRHYYIAYDDEANRIGLTLDQTRRLVHGIYNELYKRLCQQWLHDLKGVHINWSQNPNAQSLQCLHLSTGLSFMAAFANDFRYDLNDSRKTLARIRNLPGHQRNTPQHKTILQDTEQVCDDYLNDITAVRAAEGIFSQHWQPVFAPLFQLFDTISPQTLNLNI